MDNETMDSMLQLYLENYNAESGELFLIVNHNKKEETVVERTVFSVVLGKESLSVTDVNTVEEFNENVSILCLVDVSGSLDENRMEDIKNTLNSLVDNLRDGDNMCIVAMGKTLYSEGFLTDKEAIRSQITALEVLREDTNLYQGITDSIKTLQQNTDVHTKRSLLIFSDGAEDSIDGITREEVNTAIKESHIPVYTIGLPKNVSNQKLLDNVKVLGSFARISEGGIHYVPKLDNMDTEQVALDIWSDMMNSFVLTVDTSQKIAYGQEMVLQVTLTDENGQNAVDNMNVLDSELILEMEETFEEDIQEVEIHEKNSMIPVILIGSTVMVMILILVVIFLMRKKHKKDENHIVEKQEDVVEDKEPEQNDVEDDIVDEEENLVESREEIQKGLDVQLIRMGIRETAILSFQISDSISIGRDKSKSDFVVTEDNGLSGIHCIFRYQNENLYLEDASSTNGTYVNGVPIKTPIRLRQDDVILAGSYEYRIRWEKLG